MTTLFYVLGCWLLVNIIFALAMYFRPVRKPCVDSDSHPISEPGSIAPSQLSNAGEGTFDTLAGGSGPGSPEKNKGPTALSKVLFFGFWLSDGRHSA